MNNEGLSNERQEMIPMDQELNPWLQKRFEERARPLNSRGVTIDTPALIPTNDQKLLRLKGNSNRIVDSIMRHVRLTSGRFQADQIPLFPKALRSIISRTVNIGASNLYEILNLPWFRPNRGYKKESFFNSGLIARQEITDDTIDDLDDTVIQPVTESVEESRTEKPRKTSESYMNYMISSPITRKTIMSIKNQDTGSMLEKSSSLRTGHMTEIRNLIDTARDDRNESRISRGIDQPAIGKKVLPERSTVHKDDRTTKTTSAPLHHMDDRDTGTITLTGSEVTKPDSSSIIEDTKVKPAYPVKNLFYEKPLPMVKKIVQSLPFVRNIQRKEILPSGSVDKPAAQKRTEQSDNKGRLDDLEIRPVHIESPRVTPVKTDLPDSLDIKRTAVKDSPIDKESPDKGYQNHSLQSQVLYEPSISQETDTKEDTGLAYPVKDLFHRKPLTLPRKLIQSLPLIQNIQRKSLLSSESVTQTTDQRQTNQKDNYQSVDNLKTVDLYQVYAKASKPALELPLTSRAISSTKSVFHQDGILSGDSSTAVTDLVMPVDNKLDLTLAPANRMPAIQRQVEYSRIDQTPAEPVVAQSTQKIQTAEASSPETFAAAATESRENDTGINEYKPDYRTIARETYPFIRRMIMVERERRPSR
ncbi:MAG: hypothetical protein JSU58_06830 [Dehalococcoidales bacterium]|nr:MAG: hypothetical protein JSU58_06830 [Dehalococcoidales bacterium]